MALPGGELLEGTQTNFFAVVNGALHTAGEGVLEGTVRRLALEVCSREGIEVVLRPPRLAELADWEGALISSTSRLLLPVDEVYVPREGEPAVDADRARVFASSDSDSDGGDGGLARRLQRLVAAEVLAHSTPVG